MRILLKDGSGSADLKFLVKDVDRHGNVRLYFRRKGHSKIRMEHPPGSDDFMAEYKAALSHTTPLSAPIPRNVPKNDTIAWLVQEYYRNSAHFRGLDTETQTVRRRQMDNFAIEHGEKRFRNLRTKHINAIIEAKFETPHAANNLLKALRMVFKWAVKAELMSINPCKEAEKLDAPSDGHHTWTVDEILQFMARHPPYTKAGLAFALLFYLGARISDVVNLGRQMETHDGGIRWTEFKGRKRKVKITEVPIASDLRAILDMHDASGRLHYLVTEYGKPFSRKGFGNWFKKRCIEAGLAHCSAHGVRKGGATWAAESGATPSQLQGIYGWSDLKEPTRYTAMANRKKLARDGAKFLTLPDQK